jgi:hypothetical protein
MSNLARTENKNQKVYSEVTILLSRIIPGIDQDTHVNQFQESDENKIQRIIESVIEYEDAIP